MSTHNIGFYEVSKIINYHQISNTHLISSAAVHMKKAIKVLRYKCSIKRTANTLNRLGG